MATLRSTEYTLDTAGQGDKSNMDINGIIKYKHARFTGSAVTTADVIEMMKLPAGARIITPMSRLVVSDLELSATLQCGYAAHNKLKDNVVVAADVDAFISALDASSARTDTPLSESATHDAGYSVEGEAVITISLTAGTASAADTFDLHVFYTEGGSVG